MRTANRQRMAGKVNRPAKELGTAVIRDTRIVLKDKSAERHFQTICTDQRTRAICTFARNLDRTRSKALASLEVKPNRRTVPDLDHALPRQAAAVIRRAKRLLDIPLDRTRLDDKRTACIEFGRRSLDRRPASLDVRCILTVYRISFEPGRGVLHDQRPADLKIEQRLTVDVPDLADPFHVLLVGDPRLAGGNDRFLRHGLVCLNERLPVRMVDTVHRLAGGNLVGECPAAGNNCHHTCGNHLVQFL